MIRVGKVCNFYICLVFYSIYEIELLESRILVLSLGTYLLQVLDQRLILKKKLFSIRLAGTRFAYIYLNFTCVW